MKLIIKLSFCLTLLTLVGCSDKKQEEEPSRIHLAEQEAQQRKEKEAFNLEAIRLYNTGLDEFRGAAAFYFTDTFESYNADMSLISKEYYTLADIGYAGLEDASFIYEYSVSGTEDDFYYALYFLDGVIYQNSNEDKHSFSHLSEVDSYRESVIDPETSNTSKGSKIPESSKELMTVTESGDDYILVWKDPSMAMSETTATVSKSGRIKSYRIDFTDTTTMLPGSYLFQVHDYGDSITLVFPDLDEYPALQR